jgi:hypothetical protein
MQPALSHTQIGKYADIVVTHALRLADSFQDGEVREINADMLGLVVGVVVKSLLNLPRPNSDPLSGYHAAELSTGTRASGFGTIGNTSVLPNCAIQLGPHVYF